MSSARKIFSGSALRVCNLIAQVLVAFFLIPFIVHSLGDRQFGFWALAGTFVGYYGLLDLGLSAAVLQYVSVAIGKSNEAECRKIFNTAFRIQLTMGLVALLVTMMLALCAPLFWHNSADASLFRKVIAVLGVNAALLFPMRVYSGVLATTLRFDIETILDFIGMVLRTGLSVVAIEAGWGLLGLACITLLSSLPVMLLQMYYAKREAAWARLEWAGIDRQKVKSLFSYSIFTSISSVADTLRFSLDSVVISGFIGLAAVTHYKVAGVFSRYYIGIILALVGTFQPILSRLHGKGDRENLQKTFLFGIKVSTWVSVLICCGLIAWGKPFIIRWMGPSYVDAYVPLVLLSLAVFLDVAQIPSTTLLNSTFNHRSYAYMNLTEGVINLAASLALARPLGIVGVALGTLIGAFLIRVVVQPWQTCKASGLPFGSYMKFLAGLLARCALMVGAAVIIVSWGLRPDYRYLLSSALFASTLYFAGSWWIVFDSAERKRLFDTLKRKPQTSALPAEVSCAD